MTASTGGQIDTVMQEKRLFPPPKEFAAKARIKSLDEYQQLWDEAAADPPKFWADLAREELHWFEPFDEAARVERAVRRVVRRRQDERLVQLPRSQSGGRPGRPHGDSVGRRAGRHAARSPTPSCTARCASSPTCSSSSASQRATACRSTCRWCRSWRSRCWPVRGSARFTR